MSHEHYEMGLYGWDGYMPTSTQYNILRQFHENGPDGLRSVRNSTLRALERRGILHRQDSGEYVLCPEGVRMFRFLGWLPPEEVTRSDRDVLHEKFDNALDSLNIPTNVAGGAPISYPSIVDEVCVCTMSGGHERVPVPRVTGESLGDFVALERLLEHFVPDMTYFQYRRLYRDLVVRGSYDTSAGWYGSYETYSYQAVDVDSLFNYLVENGYLRS